jgi:transposase
MTKPAFLVQHTGNKPNDERRNQVRDLYLSGLTVRAVADKVGVTFQAVQSMLDRMGVPRRPRGGNTGSHSRRRK